MKDKIKDKLLLAIATIVYDMFNGGHTAIAEEDNTNLWDTMLEAGEEYRKDYGEDPWQVATDEEKPE